MQRMSQAQTDEGLRPWRKPRPVVPRLFVDLLRIGETMTKTNKIASTRYAVEEAIRLSKRPGTWESKARRSNVMSWEEIARDHNPAIHVKSKEAAGS